VTEPLYDEILAEVLDARDRGQVLALDELVSRHPGHEETARRVLESVRQYEQLRGQAVRPRPVLFDALEPGQRLGDFEIVGPLARGGMGVVYRARQLSLGGRVVALKVLASEAASVHGVARFEREAMALAGLHHPHLAEVYGFGNAHGSLFLAMRLVGGATLRDVLEKRAIRRAVGDGARERRDIVERVTEIADALALVHERGLVHRDVKPSNIVLEGSSEELPLGQSAVLVDFGLARPVDSHTLTLTGDSPATPSYAPPEQLLGQEVDARADVFCLGVTLHDLLAARRPTERTQASAGLEPIRELAPEVDEDLAAVIAHSVDPEARWRYPNAAAMRDDLRAWLAGDAVSARAIPVYERARRWMAKHPRRIVEAAVVIAAVVVAGVLLADPLASTRELRGARDVYDHGDLRELQRLSKSLSPFVPQSWFTDADVVRVLERLREETPGDRLTKLRSLLARDDLEGALFLAAEEIGRKEKPSDPVYERFFLGVANAEVSGGAQDARLTDFWSVLVARIFYEQPVTSRERESWSEPFRGTVLSLWNRPEVRPTARAYLATALGNCGQPRDLIDPLLEWALDRERSAEEMRIGLRNVEGIVRRAHGCGRLEEIPFEEIWLRMQQRSSEWLEYLPDELSHGFESAVIAACEATLIAERSVRGRTTEVSSLMRAGWIAASDDSRAAKYQNWLPCAAANDHRALLARLATLPPGALASWIEADNTMWVDAAKVGRACALLSDQELARRVETALAPYWVQGGEASFQSGKRAGELALRGIAPDQSLDDKTTLGAYCELTEEALPWTRCPIIFSPWVAPFALVSTPTRGMRSMRRGAHACWLFLSDGAAWNGAALQPLVRASEPSNDDLGSLRMYAFGHSRVELPFAIHRRSVHFDHVLVLEPQSNSREYYPYCGVSEFELELNGYALERRTWQFKEGARYRVFDLPARHLRAGGNVVAIRLLETSTTPLRLLSAAISARLPNR
jgi:serine/threonine protein kinase